MAKYRFQFETGNVCDGLIEVKVTDFIGEIADDKIKMNPSLALTIAAHGGQLVKDEPVKPKAKAKRKVSPVKWEGEK